jgi:cyclopropane fatty-acyl-phospholipid synthase-like methyltransferase
MNDARWTEFWRDHGRQAAASDPHSQVLRTFNKKPISEEDWRFTLSEIEGKFPISEEDDLLDLCCGNGLLTATYAGRCASITAVDISPELLAVLNAQALPGVTTKCADMRDASFTSGAFSKIMFYAAIQYLDHAETVSLFRNFSNWLRPGGLVLIGDIPDSNRLWSFYNTPERRHTYFQNLLAERDVVGTWFDPKWVEQLAMDCGFSTYQHMAQDTRLLNAHYRFDVKLIR